MFSESQVDCTLVQNLIVVHCGRPEGGGGGQMRTNADRGGGV